MRRFAIVVVALAIGLATALSPLASSAPDGLNRVAARQGFGDRARLAAVQRHAPAGGYAFPGVHDARLAKGLAGLAGTLAVLGLGAGTARAVRRRSRGGGMRLGNEIDRRRAARADR